MAHQFALAGNFEGPVAVPAPVVKWVGGKRTLINQLLPLTPRDVSEYYEPFFGGGAFFLSLPQAWYKHANLSDTNHSLIELYTIVRDCPEQLAKELDLLQAYVLDRERYYQIRSEFGEAKSPIKRAAQFVYLNKTGYNGLYRVNRSGKFNVPFGRFSSPPHLYQPENMLLVSAYLRRARLACEDFVGAVASAGEGDFAYLDPPYVPLSSTANFTSYTRSAFTAEDQERLAAAVHDLTLRGCRVLLSNSDTTEVRNLYKDYSIQIVYTSRRVNSNSEGRGRIGELAIRNYDII